MTGDCGLWRCIQGDVYLATWDARRWRWGESGRQCPLLALSVCGTQMVWECACVCVCMCVCVCVCVCACVHACMHACVCMCMCMRACVCGQNELEVCTTLACPCISVHSVLCQCYTQVHAHTYPQTIWRQWTDGAKSGHCRVVCSKGVYRMMFTWPPRTPEGDWDESGLWSCSQVMMFTWLGEGEYKWSVNVYSGVYLSGASVAEGDLRVVSESAVRW